MSLQNLAVEIFAIGAVAAAGCAFVALIDRRHPSEPETGNEDPWLAEMCRRGLEMPADHDRRNTL